MRFFRYKRENTFGTYNFGQYQVYVCELSDAKGKVHLGLSILPGDNLVEVPFPLSSEKGLSLAKYLSESVSGNLPSSYKVKSGWANYFMNMHIVFKKEEKNEIKGRIALGSGLRFVTISKSSIRACVEALNKAYKNA